MTEWRRERQQQRNMTPAAMLASVANVMNRLTADRDKLRAQQKTAIAAAVAKAERDLDAMEQSMFAAQRELTEAKSQLAHKSAVILQMCDETTQLRQQIADLTPEE